MTSLDVLAALGKPTQRSYLVIGGGGFLGRAVAEQLADRGEKNVSLFDLGYRNFTDTRFRLLVGNICQPDTLRPALKDIHTVIHTASPTAGNNRSLYYKVNVEGTRNIVQECLAAGVKQLVFTSSASVVFEGKDLKNADESTPISKNFFDYYSESKYLAEKEVLAANGKNGMLTVSIRPSAIFGPRDVQMWPGFIEAAKAGKNKYMIGDGTNLTDYTYVENVALAHILAADGLSESSGTAGQAYFITNDEPIPFWDMAKFCYRGLGYSEPTIKIPYVIMYYLAITIDFFVWLLSPIVTLNPTFTFLKISVAGSHRTYNISRAKRELRYRPAVNMQEALRRTLVYFKEVESKKKTQ